ncbi:hypothetical protein ACFSE1_16950 [Rhizobium helianthi]|uniref:Uncharacterized protein n=1 Tax=Rhizobium helianthi TaxID=1132695 RepID=A0ABW4M740_9HYPH
MSKKNKRDPLSKLLKHWSRASMEEQAHFLAFINKAPSSLIPYTPERSSTALIANGRYLLPETVKRVETVMMSRSIGPATVAEELGFPGEGHSLTRALVKRSSLRLFMIAALDRWLQENEAGRAAGSSSD